LKLLPPDKGGEERVGEKRGEKGWEGTGMKGKEGEKDFRAFPQFQVCHCTTGYRLLHGL